MYLFQNIIQEMEEKYQMFLEEKQGILYVYRKLWKEYDIAERLNEEDLLKQLVYNIVWANMIIKEDTDIIEYYGMKIRKILREYEVNKEKLCTYCSYNDMKQIEGMINQISASKDKMYPFKHMISDMEETYCTFLNENRGIEYVFIRFWEEYDTYRDRNNEEGKLQILVFDIIIASMNVKEETSIVEGFGMEIRRMMREYEENKENLPIYYDDNDMQLIENMIDQINACKEKWIK